MLTMCDKEYVTAMHRIRGLLLLGAKIISNPSTTYVVVARLNFTNATF